MINYRTIRSQGHFFKLERWQGPPNINKVKEYETVLPLKVSLFIRFIRSWKQREFVYLVCLSIKINQEQFFSSLIKMYTPNLHSAPLIVIFQMLCYFQSLEMFYLL